MQNLKHLGWVWERARGLPREGTKAKVDETHREEPVFKNMPL